MKLEDDEIEKEEKKSKENLKELGKIGNKI